LGFTPMPRLDHPMTALWQTSHCSSASPTARMTASSSIAPNARSSRGATTQSGWPKGMALPGPAGFRSITTRFPIATARCRKPVSPPAITQDNFIANGLPFQTAFYQQRSVPFRRMNVVVARHAAGVSPSARPTINVAPAPRGSGQPRQQGRLAVPLEIHGKREATAADLAQKPDRVTHDGYQVPPAIGGA